MSYVLEFMNNSVVRLILRCIPLACLSIYGLWCFKGYVEKYIMLKNSKKYKDIGTKLFKVVKASKGFNSVTYFIESEDKNFKAEMYLPMDKLEEIKYDDKNKKKPFSPKYKILKKGDDYGELHIWADPDNNKHYLVMGKEEKFRVVPHAWVMIFCGIIVLGALVGIGVWLFNVI